ncbi:MAG: endonuclease/exonuclease/phosphatase family protein [Jiangellaceae bacterium]
MRRALPAPGLLVVLTTAVLAELMRVSFPLLYDFAGQIGFATAAAVVPLLFAVSLVAGPLGAVVGVRALLVIGVGGLALARVVTQISTTPVLAVALGGLLAGLVGISVALRVSVARVGPAVTGSALFLGLAIDTAIRLGLTTWDAAWRSDPFSWGVGLAVPVGVVAALLSVARAGGAWGADSLRFAALPGPLLALQALFLANPGFGASSGQVGLPTAGAVTLVGLGLAAAVPAARGRIGWVAGAILVAVAAALTGPTGLTGSAALVGLLVGQVAVGAVVAAACERAATGSDGRSVVRTGLGAAVGTLALVASLLPYQISYELPLGVPQFTFAVVAAVALLLAAGLAPERADDTVAPPPLRWAAALAPVPLLLVPAWLALTWPSPAGGTDDDVRVATYNIHAAVDWNGRLDPEATAEVLENGGAEVVMLQEVARGWPLAGGLDTASWLGRRLGADVAYGTAADHQFGNAVLSTRPILERWSETLDRGGGTMQRGFVGATIRLGDSTVDVWSTHLQHQDHTTATRQAQARAVIEAWAGAERTVIGGDLNSRPNSADIGPWFDGTGLVSAQDVAGDPAWNTSPALHPDHRIDWIFGSADLEFTDVAVPQTLASDHLPIFATVRGT